MDTRRSLFESSGTLAWMETKARNPARTPHPKRTALHRGHTLEYSLPSQTPRVLTEVPGPKSRALTSREPKHLAPGVQSISTLSGIAVESASGSIIQDVDGNRFLDLAAGICVNALGHSH